MLSFLKLIRLPNLLMIVLIQYAMRYGIIYSLIRVNDFTLQLSSIDFLLLVLSTVFIAAGGYIINDFYDTKIDAINKPDKVIVGVGISRTIAISIYAFLNITAIVIGFYIGTKAGIFKLGFIHLLAAGSLFYYSTTFKKGLIIGNILIAILAALVPLLVGVVEIPLLNKKYLEILIEWEFNFNRIFFFILIYSVFAFFMTLIREIIKDIEDMEGDSLFGSMTIPIAYGIKRTKTILYILVALVMLILADIQFIQYMIEDMISFFYFLIALQLPLLFLIYKISKAEVKKDFSKLSLFVKGIMLAGIGYSGVIFLVAYA